MTISWRSIFPLLLLISLAALAAPFLVMAGEQALGLLAEGAAPWQGQWERFTIFLPSVVLAPPIAILAVLLAMLERRWRPLLGGLGLLGLHVAGLLLQLQMLGWLVG